MPNSVEKRFEKLEFQFFWEGKTARVNRPTLKLPLDEGGQNLVDIKLRNDAIHLVHLINFLGLNGPVPRWAVVVQDILRCNVLSAYKNMGPNILTNIFLQTWDSVKSDLPSDVKRMLKVAREVNLTLDGLDITPEVKRSLPIWLHQGWAPDNNRRTNDEKARCLQAAHKVLTTGDAQDVAEGRDERLVGCEDTAACQRRAQQLLDALDPKWDPRTPSAPNDRPANADEAENEFPRHVTPVSDVADLFRVFAKGKDLRGAEAHVVKDVAEAEPPVHKNACIALERNKLSDDGVGVWFKTDDPRNTPLIPPRDMNDETTLTALGIQRILECTPESAVLTITVNSKTAIKNMTALLSKNEDAGWPKTRPEHKKLMQETPWNERSTIPRYNSSRPELSWTTDGLPDIEKSNAMLTGMKLRGLTQRKAYIELKKRLAVKRRKATEANIDRIKYALRDLNGAAPSMKKIWRSTRGKNTSKKSQMFRWRCIHEAHATGEFFMRMENMSHRAICEVCGAMESMEHILLECNAGTHEVVWDIAKELWEQAGEEWPELTYGLILGCGAAQPSSKDKSKAVRDGHNRLYQRLISEGSFLLWKLRNNRRIEHDGEEDYDRPRSEVKNKYLAALRASAKADFAMTNKARYGKQAIGLDIVMNTWRELATSSSEQEDRSSRARAEQVGVLVGSGLTKALDRLIQGVSPSPTLRNSFEVR
ncbi:hypothetical protein CPB85DRAFT_1511645 [Mucidula mucida]|nr:hypothetical protein CPB85DRAFT_1511645 [Mucidula mucida]